MKGLEAIKISTRTYDLRFHKDASKLTPGQMSLKLEVLPGVMKIAYRSRVNYLVTVYSEDNDKFLKEIEELKFVA